MHSFVENKLRFLWNRISSNGGHNEFFFYRITVSEIFEQYLIRNPFSKACCSFVILNS